MVQRISMSSELFQFLWPVPMGGFQWHDGELATDAENHLVPPGTGRKTRVLVDNPARSIYSRRDDPLRDHPALFRTFAALPGTEESIVQFADEFGNLGKGYLASIRPGGEFVGTTGETIDDWRESIRQMKEAVCLWELIHSGDRKGLQKVIQWMKDPQGRAAVVFVPDKDLLEGASPQLTVIASSTSFQEWMTKFIPSDPFLPATAYLLRLINAQIEGEVLVRLRYDLDQGEAVLRMVPQTLLGCLWLELANAISGDKSQRQCPGCGRWFEIQAHGSRSDKQFCSQACRNRIYRQRMAKARQWRKEGKKPKEIAETLDVDLASVKKWLSVR